MKDNNTKSQHDTDTKAKTHNAENIPAKPKDEKDIKKQSLTETLEQSESASKNQNTLKMPEELGPVNTENTDLH